MFHELDTDLNLLKCSKNFKWKYKINLTKQSKPFDLIGVEFDDHVKSCGIISQLTPLEHQNGMVYPKGAQVQ